jgi:hypothetical protein
MKASPCHKQGLTFISADSAMAHGTTPGIVGERNYRIDHEEESPSAKRFNDAENPPRRQLTQLWFSLANIGLNQLAENLGGLPCGLIRT